MPETDLIWLSLLVFLPAIFAAGLLVIPSRFPEAMRWWALFGSAGTLSISLCVVVGYYALLDTHLDANGSPLTEEARMTERFRRVTYGKLEIDVTVNDPKAYTAPWSTDQSNRPATAVAANGTSKQFQFVTALGTIEQFDDLSLELKQKPGILDVSGTERTITPVWDPARLDEAGVRRILAEAGHPVRP